MYSGSAIVDLKAELSRKEGEIGKKSKNPDVSSNTNTNDNHKRIFKNKTFEKIQEMTSKKKKTKNKDGSCSSTVDHPSKQHGEETDEMYERAKQKLAAKTKIYEKMQSGQMEDVEDFQGETRYLVDFQQKLYDEESLERRRNSSDEDQATDNKRTITSEAIFEANEEHREKLHEKWRQEQEDILNGPVHYQNIKFDEIRNLGTGYYAFSKNEEERQKQLEELQNMREETISIQQKKDKLRLKRKAALQERLNKVKQRKSKESGQPFEQDSELSFDDPKVQDTSDNNKLSEPGEASETVESILNENMLRECRQASCKKEREWDKGKQSQFVAQPFVKPKATLSNTTTTVVKNSYEKMLDERRKERAEEFAPPSFY